MKIHRIKTKKNDDNWHKVSSAFYTYRDRLNLCRNVDDDDAYMAILFEFLEYINGNEWINANSLFGTNTDKKHKLKYFLIQIFISKSWDISIQTLGDINFKFRKNETL